MNNIPGFDPSILRHSGIWGAADEAVLNNLHKKENKSKKSPFLYITVLKLINTVAKKWAQITVFWKPRCRKSWTFYAVTQGPSEMNTLLFFIWQWKFEKFYARKFACSPGRVHIIFYHFYCYTHYGILELFSMNHVSYYCSSMDGPMTLHTKRPAIPPFTQRLNTWAAIVQYTTNKVAPLYRYFWQCAK
jgi:hypothetical protein